MNYFLVIENPPAFLQETPDRGLRDLSDSPSSPSDLRDTGSFDGSLLDLVHEKALALDVEAAASLKIPLKKTSRNTFIGLTLGRGFDNDICLNDPKLSKFHGWLFSAYDDIEGPYRWYYTDCGSKNGSCINDVPCKVRQEYRLHVGDSLSVGSLRMRLVDG